MARPRVIVGIGEALLCEYPDRIEAGGLAALVAVHAARLGDNGIVISRLGQDRAGEEVLRQLAGAAVSAAHLQSDPDLPTGRLIVRTVAGKTNATLSARAAFDNLQWDFDLVDVAQQADAVVFGNLGRRDGQSRSVIKQFLAECTGAMRVFDLTSRGEGLIDRADIRSALEYTDAVIADAAVLKVMAPAWSSPHLRDGAMELCAANRLSFVATIDRGPQGESMAIYSSEGSWSAPRPFAPAQHESMIVSVLHEVLSGGDFASAMETGLGTIKSGQK